MISKIMSKKNASQILLILFSLLFLSSCSSLNANDESYYEIRIEEFGYYNSLDEIYNLIKENGGDIFLDKSKKTSFFINGDLKTLDKKNIKTTIPKKYLNNFKNGLKEIETNNWHVKIIDSQESLEGAEQKQEITLHIKPYLEKERFQIGLTNLILLLIPIMFIFFILVVIFSWI